MKQKARLFLAIIMCFTITFPLFAVNAQAAQTINSNKTGNQGGYDYELWKDYGTTSMTLNEGGAFGCSWSNIGNALFRKGKKFNETQTHQQIGNISVKYNCNYQPVGNSYLCVYGWTSDPLIEYYIVDSWGSWRPPGATSKGTINVDGGTYDVYETTRTNQPSIKGNKTFKQYWSVRTSKRTNGTISVSEHFKAWENKGMKLGKMYEVAFTVEGYQSSGKADVTEMSINIGGNNTPTTNNKPVATINPVTTKKPVTTINPVTTKKPVTTINPVTTNTTTTNSNNGTTSAFSTIEAEKYSTTTSSTIKVSGNGSGGKAISYIRKGDTVTYRNVNFGNGASSFKASVASGQNSKIEIRKGNAKGTLLGTLSKVSTGGFNTYRSKSTSISKVTGVQDLVLVFSGAVNVDSFVFSGDNNSVNNTANTNSWWKNWDWIWNWMVKPSNNNNNATVSTAKPIVTATPAATVTPAAITTVTPAAITTVTPAAITTVTPAAISTVTGASITNTQKTTDKYVALTFDDGPNLTITPLVLDKLEKYKAKASFFLIGKNMNDAVKPVIQRQLKLGCEINSHSYSHSYMNSFSKSQIVSEMQQTSDLINKMAGVRPKFFRPPYISTSKTLYEAIDLPFINGINCNDWDASVSAQKRATTILNNVKDGDIILLHDYNGNNATVTALDTIIPGLQNKGYKLVTVSELFQLKGVNPNVEYKIWSNVSK